MSSSISRSLSFKPGTFPGGAAACDSWCSSVNADGIVFFLFVFDFGHFGAAIFEIQCSLVHGIVSIMRQGPSGIVSSNLGLQILEERAQELETDGIKFIKISPLTLLLVLKDTMNECSQILTQQDAMYFGNWKVLCLCLHCHMYKCMDSTYLKSSPSSGIWKYLHYNVKLCLENPSRLNLADLEFLAVQTPYIFMGSKRYGNKKPSLLLVKRVASFMAWWRRLQGKPREEWKADQNAILANELQLDNAHLCLDALLESARRNREAMRRDLFDLPRAKLHTWPSGNLQDVVFTSDVSSWHPIPAWLKSPAPLHPVAYDSLDATPGAAAISTVRLAPPVSHAVSPTESAASPARAVWRDQARMNGPTLSAHNELGGWSWPEFLPSQKGAPKPASDSAAGSSPRWRSHRVVAADEGAAFAPFLRLDRRDFLDSVDNAAAERLHRSPSSRPCRTHRAAQPRNARRGAI